MEKFIWSDYVKKEEVVRGVKEERNNLHTITRRKANWIGHILRKKCLLKNVIEGKIEGTGRRGRRSKHLLCDEGSRRSCNLKEEALDRTLWRSRFGRVCRLVRQTA
jgi:hypothetical protein